MVDDSNDYGLGKHRFTHPEVLRGKFGQHMKDVFADQLDELVDENDYRYMDVLHDVFMRGAFSVCEHILDDSDPEMFKQRLQQMWEETSEYMKSVLEE